MTPQPKELKVTLIGAPSHPLGLIFYVWRQSRSNVQLPSPKAIEAVLSYASNNKSGFPTPEVYQAVYALGYSDPEDPDNKSVTLDQIRQCAKMIMDEIEMIMDESIPVIENLNFVFHLENIPISLREQLVRHRIGTAIDPRVGADIVPLASRDLISMKVVPDLAESSWWSQTSRVINQGKFYDEGRWILPESLEGKTVPDFFSQTIDAPVDAIFPYDSSTTVPQEGTAEEVYRHVLSEIQRGYNALVAAGVHIEDARQILPVGSTHGITWSLNAKALGHILGKRSCFISQVGIWENVMSQMISELRTKVHPMFQRFLTPICVKNGKYTGCPVAGTNKERTIGKDHTMPPCPLYIKYETEKAVFEYNRDIHLGDAEYSWSPPDHPEEAGSKAGDIREWTSKNEVSKEMLEKTSGKFTKLWGQDIFNPTWEK